MSLSAFQPDNVAVVTGAASGIGLAAARRFAGLGLRVCLSDLAGPRLEAARVEVAKAAPGGADCVMAVASDVATRESVRRLEREVLARFGPVHVLMNNAGISPKTGIFGPSEDWARLVAVNLWGVIHGTQVFGPGMVAHGAPATIINTGSKQGITTPPGNPAYNMTKAGVKAFTEALQHELRNTPGCGVTAHLLIPGFVFTGLTAGDRTEKPAAAWTPDETVDFMMDSLARGDFYILCPDNDVTRAIDGRRILWAAGDIVENRPPLSRWHPDHGEAFRAFLEGPSLPAG